MLKQLAGLCLASCLWLLAPRGQAQGEGESAAEGESAEYKQAVQAALEEYRLQHYEEARSLFQHAHGLDPNARTLRGLGMVEFELRHYVRAAELLEEALASERKPLTAEQRSAVEELLARTRQFIALYNLEVKPAEADLAVELDGKRVELPEDNSLSLEAGEHVLRISAPGAEPRELRIDVKGGEHQTLRIELEVHQPAPETRSESPTSRSPRRRRTAIGLMSTGGALLIGGGVLGVLALTDAKDSATREGSSADRAHSMAIAADVSLGIGAALAVLGVVLRLTEPDADEPGEATTFLQGSRLGVRF